MPNNRDQFGTTESDVIEYKESWDDDCLKALAAFANSLGGSLLIGIADSGTVVGWSGDGKDQERISSSITATLQVHPVSMTVRHDDGKAILHIRMSKAASPVALRGRYYRRIGNSSREVPAEELPRFLLERTGQSWDGVPGEFGADAISDEAIADFRVLAKSRLPKITASDTFASILTKLRLTGQDGRLLRASVLLFGIDPQRHFTSAQVQIGRFKDDATILDDKRIEGNLFEQLERVIDALRQYLFVRYDVPTQADDRRGVESLQRREVWEYPFDALREGLINALIHRDYTSTGRIQIRVYDNRIIISNPGSLPPGLSVNDLIQEPHDSLPRNPILAQVFYYANLVEQWGSGTIRMAQACRSQDLPVPEFDAASNKFTVTFRANAFTNDHLRQLGLNDRQVRAVRYMFDNGSISSEEYQSLFGVVRRTAARDFDLMLSLGVIVHAERSGRTVRFILDADRLRKS